MAEPNAPSLEEAVGANIRRMLERAGVTQEAFGQRLATYLESPWTRQAVSAATKGKRAFTAAELVTLAAVLDSTVFELLQVDEPVRMPNGELMGPETVSRLLLADENVVQRHTLALARAWLDEAAEAENDIRNATIRRDELLRMLRSQMRQSPSFRSEVEQARDRVRAKHEEQARKVHQADVDVARALGQKPPDQGVWEPSPFEKVCNNLLEAESDG